MRKLLLATVAALGASMGVATYADAQIVDNTDGQSFPTPGTVTVRLNGRFRFYAGFDRQRRSPRAEHGGSRQTTPRALGRHGRRVGDEHDHGRHQQARELRHRELCPLVSGLRRRRRQRPEVWCLAGNPAGQQRGAGGGALRLDHRQQPRRGALYLRREWGYIGTDQFGTLRLGCRDQPTSLYLTGTFETFDDGGLNGDLPGFLPGAVASGRSPTSGNLYTTNKIVYLSPQFYGVDFGLSFEPSTGSVGHDNVPAAARPPLRPGFTSPARRGDAGLRHLSSTSTGDIARRKDTYEGLVRYRGTFGPVGIAATASYDGSGRVLDSGLAPVNGVVNPTNPKRQA